MLAGVDELRWPAAWLSSQLRIELALWDANSSNSCWSQILFFFKRIGTLNFELRTSLPSLEFAIHQLSLCLESVPGVHFFVSFRVSYNMPWDLPTCQMPLFCLTTGLPTLSNLPNYPIFLKIHSNAQNKKRVVDFDWYFMGKKVVSKVELIIFCSFKKEGRREGRQK